MSMFILYRTDKDKKPEVRRCEEVESYREFDQRQDNTELNDVKTVIYWKKEYNRKPTYSTMSIEELHEIFKPLNYKP